MTNFRDKLLETFTEHQDALKRFFRRRLGNPVLAEDLAQETWIRAASADGAAVSNPRAYLFRIAANLAIDHRRHVSRGVEVEANENLFELIADLRPSPESETVSRNEYAHVLKVLDALPPRCRDVFILNKFEDMSYHAIARKLGISRSTVVTSMVAALSALEVELKLKKKSEELSADRRRQTSQQSRPRP